MSINNSMYNCGREVPLTGSIASFGEPDPWVAQQIEDYVNNEMGGVYLSGAR